MFLILRIFPPEILQSKNLYFNFAILQL